MTKLIKQVTSLGGFIILDSHDSMRRKSSDADPGLIVGESVVTPLMYADYWIKLANIYKSDPRVIFNISNEPHDQSTEILVSSYNVIIAAIRATGANNAILLDGNDYTGMTEWNAERTFYGHTSNAGPMLNIVDSADNIIFDVHMYFDRSGGTIEDCVAGEGIRSDYLGVITKWARDHGKRLFLGEFGGGNNRQCLLEMEDALSVVEANNDVWMGWSYLGAYGDAQPFNEGVAWFFGLDDPVTGFDYRNPRSDARTVLLGRFMRPRSKFQLTDLGATKLRAWYRPSTATKSLWPDSSGNGGRDFIQPIENRQPTVTKSPDGLSMTSGQYMEAFGMSSGPLASNEIVFAIVTASRSGQSRSILSSNPPGPGRELLINTSGYLVANNQGSLSFGGSANAITFGVKQLLVFEGAASGERMLMSINGGKEQRGTHATGFTGTGITRLGAFDALSDETSIHELVILSTQTTLGERAKVVASLMRAHGISDLLPSSPTHPYRNGSGPFTLPPAGID